MARYPVAGVLLACAFLLVSAGPALSQSSPVSVIVGAGATLPVAGTRSSIGDGWNVGVGAEFAVSGPFGVRVDYLYSRFGSEDAQAWAVPAGRSSAAGSPAVISGREQMHAGSVDLVYTRPVRDGRASVYALGGPSVFRRRVTMTSAATGLASGFCAAQWLQCPAADVPFDQVTGVREATTPGLNVGGGMTFNVGLNARLVVEARYYMVRGDSFATATGTVRSRARYVPVTIGLRF